MRKLLYASINGQTLHLCRNLIFSINSKIYLNVEDYCLGPIFQANSKENCFGTKGSVFVDSVLGQCFLEICKINSG